VDFCPVLEGQAAATVVGHSKVAVSEGGISSLLLLARQFQQMRLQINKDVMVVVPTT